MYEATGVTTPSRHADRASYEAAVVHEILDRATFGHVAFVADGQPQLLPMLFVRQGSEVFIHSSTGAHIARLAARNDGVDVAFETTLLDALVLARSAFNHSANYRSVVVHGRARLVRDAGRKAQVLEALLEKLVPGRAPEVRGPSESELRQTAVLGLALEKVSAKVRSGPPSDEPEDLSLEHWAGIWPVREVRGAPEPAPDLRPGIDLPAHLRGSGGDTGR